MNKSHHDVLGIRPYAGREEIELAYKGRRSQYHPDRYGQADADTQRWATTCMQEVNAAYAALIDAKPSTSSAAPVREATASAATTPAPTTLAESLRTHSISGRALERIYFAPNIPLKKLHNALESYADELRPSDVLALLDDTIFSSGKDGLLLTEHQLWIKEAFQPRGMVPLDGIRFSLRKGVLHANDNRIRDFNITDKDELGEFVQALNESLARRSAVQAAPPPVRSSTDARAAVYMLEEIFLELLQHLERAKRQENLGRKVVNMMALMEVAVSLTDKLQDAAAQVRGAPLGPNELSWLRSDPVRLELLTYQFAWMTHELKNRIGRSDSQVDHDLELFMTHVIAPSLAVLLAKDSDDYQRALHALPDSGLSQVFGGRAQHYFDLLCDPSSDIGLQLFNGLCRPMAFNAPDVSRDEAALARWQAAARNSCGPKSLELLTREMHHILGMGLNATYGPGT